MDIVKVLRANTERLNELKQCDFCWEFSAPFFESINNIVQDSEPCCVQVRLVNYRERKANEYRNGFKTGNVVDYIFTLQILKQSQMGINMDNEIKGYPLDQSKWATIYQPLRDCFSDDNFIDWCDVLGLQVEVPSWEATQLTNYNGLNYDGWNVSFLVKIRNES